MEYRICWHSFAHPNGADYIVCREGHYPRAGHVNIPVCRFIGA